MEKDNRIFIIIGLLIVTGIVVYVIANSENSSPDFETPEADTDIVADELVADEVDEVAPYIEPVTAPAEPITPPAEPETEPEIEPVTAPEIDSVIVPDETVPVQAVELSEVQIDSVPEVVDVVEVTNNTSVDSEDSSFLGTGDRVSVKPTVGSGPSLMDVRTNEGFSPGVYTSYTDDAAVVAAAKRGDAVLFFHAAWCPTCRTLDGDITRNAGSIPPNVTIFKVDYDTASELKRRYQVQYQHTLVHVDENLEGIKKWTGSSRLSAVLSQV